MKHNNRQTSKLGVLVTQLFLMLLASSCATPTSSLRDFEVPASGQGVIFGRILLKETNGVIICPPRENPTLKEQPLSSGSLVFQSSNLPESSFSFSGATTAYIDNNDECIFAFQANVGQYRIRRVAVWLEKLDTVLAEFTQGYITWAFSKYIHTDFSRPPTLYPSFEVRAGEAIYIGTFVFSRPVITSGVASITFSVIDEYDVATAAFRRLNPRFRGAVNLGMVEGMPHE